MLDNESMILQDILLQEGGCRVDQLEAVAEEHERSGKPYIDVLVDFGLTTKQHLFDLMATSLGSEFCNFNEMPDVSHDIVARIPSDVAHSYGAVPVGISDNGGLKIALRNPLNYQATDDLRFVLNCDVQVVVADPDQIDAAIERYYPLGDANIQDVIQEMRYSEDSIGNESEEDAANKAPIVRFVDLIIEQAIKDKASDIHFEPFEKNFRVRYRVDGALYELPPPPKSMALPVTSRIKIMSNLNISERRLPQDGRIQLKVKGRPVDLRVSCLPTTYGESVVLRVLDRSAVSLELDTLGLGADVREKIRELIHLPNGIMLVTGPTGSGKTTTLYSCLREINVIEDKLLTAEDPVEYDIEGLVQVPINDAVGMTFEKALRAFLRQDPDRILVGEIRDFVTAQIAIEASLTGHLVFSTLHTNDSASTITRLVDMGLEPYLICSSLIGILGQRLIRRVCPNCKVAYEPTDEELVRLNLDRADIGDAKFYYGRGCTTCNGTGYKGRKSICELLVVNNAIVDLISENAPTSALREKAREQGMRTIREDGLMSVLNGETTVDEVLRYTH